MRGRRGDGEQSSGEMTNSLPAAGRRMRNDQVMKFREALSETAGLRGRPRFGLRGFDRHVGE